MSKKYRWKGIRFCLALLAMVLVFMTMDSRVDARTDVSGLITNRNASFITWTYDHQAWTIAEPIPAETKVMYKDYAFNGVPRPYYWYLPDAELYTGVPMNLREPGVGQHKYDYERAGVIPINRWVNVHACSSCIHGDKNDFDYHGTVGPAEGCGYGYFSGWFGYCADCGEVYDLAYLYGPPNLVQQLQGVDNTVEYYYRCAHCYHLEQGRVPSPHICKDISYNQYKIVYHANGVDVEGEANETLHMVNNATTYRGVDASYCTNRVSDNDGGAGFRMDGYKVIGWDYAPGDPYGTPDLAIGQEIYNLSLDDWMVGRDDGSGKGTITLYAVWSKVEGNLTIMPGNSADIAKGATYNDSGVAGRTYNASTRSTTIHGKRFDNYVISNTKLTAPKQGTVSFVTNTSEVIASQTVRRVFKSWEKALPFKGSFQESTGKYVFTSLIDGVSDTVTAVWQDNSIILPTPSASGSQVFAGWYTDPGCTNPVGSAGDKYTPSGDITLYAKWSQLVLYSVTDLTVDGGKGGVDLSWTQEDPRPKFYKIYQRRYDQASWSQIFSADDVGGSGTGWSGGYKADSTAGATRTITIPATGFYTIDAYGAQGSDYSGKSGGKGGYVGAKFWLTAGDVITYHIGTRTEGGSGGGSGAAGGGSTYVTSARLGTLVVAGGGGGANWYMGGGAGGYTSGLVSGTNGTAGVGGGGDGYNGGGGGTVNTHVHQGTCYHHCGGNPITGGGCYALSGCPGRYYEYETPIGGYYQNWPDYENPKYEDCWDYEADKCVQCWLNPCCGEHPWYEATVWKCNSCGYERQTYDYLNNAACGNAAYVKVCGKTDGQVICGKTTSTVESANAAYGGSSYVNPSATWSSQTPGYRSGTGYFKITENTVGYFDAMHMDDVSANDLAKPNAIDSDSVEITVGAGMSVNVKFEKPEDNGTEYYHYAESYLASNPDAILSTTKPFPTYNNIVTGVKRYYYRLDTSAGTTVTASNKQSESTTPMANVAVSATETRYLHVAPVDAAGNIGPTTHITIEPRDIEWNLKTQQISVSSTVGGTNYGSVYASGTNRYYVRADGVTPFSMSFGSYVEGVATDTYQIDNQQFDIAISGGGTQTFNTVLPKTSASVAGSVNISSSQFSKSSHGTVALTDAGISSASRSNKAVNNAFSQAFFGKQSMSGKSLDVVPRAGASFINEDLANDVTWSDASQDAANRVTLILDGVGPVIYGTAPIEVSTIDLSTGDINMDISAADALSGLKSLSVTITNMDDGTSRTYTPSGDGHVRFTMSATNSLFNGTFRVEVTAKDNVGNRTIVKYEPVSIGVVAKLNKAVADGLTTFAVGEGALLDITAIGYVDKVIIYWPSDVLADNPGLPTTIDYTGRKQYTQVESIPFIVPWSASDGDIIQVPVKVIKGGLEKTAYPNLEVYGNIMDDIRYRIQ